MSARKAASNRLNGQKSHGPTNTMSTRFNATKHGLLSMGITELDDAEGYHALLNDLRTEKAPVGIVETLLVDSIALDVVRLLRARRLEAEYITAELNPPIIQSLGSLGLSEPAILDPGLPAAIGPDSGQRLVNVFQRYESTFSSRIFRLLHELERLQRMRNGERLPAPAVVDVSVHASVPEILGGSNTEIENSRAPAEEQLKSLDAVVDMDVHANAGIMDMVPEVLEQGEKQLSKED